VNRTATWALCAIALAAAPAPGATGTTAADYYRRAFHVATVEARIELLTRALAVNPNHVPSLRYRSTLHAIQGRDEPAYADAARAADLSPADPDLNYSAGLKADKLKRYADAARLYGRALALDRTSTRVRIQYLFALIKLRRIDPALKQADRLVELRPDTNVPYSVRADVYEWADRYADAVRDLTVLVGRDPKNASHYLRRCINYRCLGEGEKALADAETAVQLKGGTAYGHAARGCSYEMLGQLDNALADYRRADEIAAREKADRRFYTIWRCIVLRKQGKRAEADALARQFLKTLKDDEWVAPVLKYLAGEMTEAEVFRRAQHQDPDRNREQHCEAYYYVGACHLADGKLDRAEALFKKCLAQRVNNFYEHGFALRDLRTIKKRRAKTGAKGNAEGHRGQGRPR